MNNRDIILTKVATEEPLTAQEQAEFDVLRQDSAFVSESEQTTAAFSQFNQSLVSERRTPSAHVMQAVMAEAEAQVQQRPVWAGKRIAMWVSVAAAILMMAFVGVGLMSGDGADNTQWVKVGEQQPARANSADDPVKPLERIKPPTSLNPVNGGSAPVVAAATKLTDEELDSAFDDLSLIFEDDLLLFHTVADSSGVSSPESDVDSALDDLEQLF